ncbi:MAG: nickel pincer cofactor biosynthesis protein LarC2 [Nitrososphaerales archaeon]
MTAASSQVAANSQDNTPPNSSPSNKKGHVKFDRDVVAIVESNVDDTSGEILGRTIERLMSEGALDATVMSYLGKKGRMGQTIRVVCSTDSTEKFAQVLVEETGTMGVKLSEVTRLIVPRKELDIPIVIEGFKGNVRIKVTETRGRLRIKPELSVAKQISDSQKIPLREVLESISFAARQHLLNDSTKSGVVE